MSELDKQKETPSVEEQIEKLDASLEAWRIWATNMKMLRDIHKEIDGELENHNNLIYSDEPHKLMKEVEGNE